MTVEDAAKGAWDDLVKDFGNADLERIEYMITHMHAFADMLANAPIGKFPKSVRPRIKEIREARAEDTPEESARYQHLGFLLLLLREAIHEEIKKREDTEYRIVG